ncbi:MAG: AsmA-like C-terminal region-containing protein [Elusimicrobia bacterium]|nr:AsmA-like C-terminal region-containing protein [Elusimicrobiota bacterium]
MTHGMPTIYKILLGAAAVALAGIAALTIALKIWLPPQKVQQFIVERAGKALGREVRLKSVDLGVIKGLVVEGLEVSEKPDFKAGVFAGVETFRFRIRLLPLLRKAVVIDEITVAGPSLAVVQLKPGVFNFSDLLEAPAKAAPSAPSAPALPFALQAAVVGLKDGRIAYQDKVSGARWRVEKLRGVIKDLSLAKPFGVQAGLQAEQLAPGRLKAKLDFDGRVDLSWMSSGKLSLDIKKLSADLSGLALSLAGPVQLDGQALKAEDLKGKLGNGKLAIKVLVRDFNTAPDARLEASLSELDAAQLLEVKDTAAGPQSPAPAAGQGPRSPKAQAVVRSPEGTPPMKTSGKVEVGKIRYRTFQADNLLMSWDLKGITPDQRRLSGWAKLSVGGGTFASEAGGGGRSQLMKALLIPLAVLRQIGRLGSSVGLLPSFDQLVFSEIKGDYVFQNGLMTIRDFHMDSAAAKVSAAGTIDLPAQTLALQVTIALANVEPIGVDVGGTFDEPKPRLRLTKALAAPVQKLAQPAVDILKGLFKKR